MSQVILHELSKSFGDVQAVDNVSLAISDGEFVSLLGPSGCGKTTTLRLLAGFIRPNQGDIFIGERLVSSASKGIFVPPSERHIGMVFQDYALWPHMRVRDNVAYPLKLRGIGAAERARQVDAALALVHMTGCGDRFPHELSGGQQQRIALARALVTRPDVLLLDEPLSNLDAKLREAMRFEIKALQRQLGMTVVYVTHDQSEAMVMSDRIVVMDRGHVCQIGSPRTIYRTPANRFVANFIGQASFLPGRVDETDDGQRRLFLGTPDQESLCAWQPPKGIRGPVTVCLRPHDIQVANNGGDMLATVVQSTYLGDSTLCIVSAVGQEVRLVLPEGMSLNPGQTVGLHVRHAVLLPAEEMQ